MSWYAGQDELSDGDYGYKRIMLIFGFKNRRALSSIRYKFECNAQIPSNPLEKIKDILIQKIVYLMEIFIHLATFQNVL